MQMLLSLLGGIKKQILKLLENKYRKLGISWLQLRRLKNLPVNGNKATKIFNKTIFFNSKEEFFTTVNEIFLHEIYKYDPGNVSTPFIIDCGANIGLSTLYFGVNYPNAEIIAFEPDAKNFELLKSNCKSFNIKNANLIQKAVWSANGTVSFIEQGSMMSRIEENTIRKLNVVETVRLRELIDRPVSFLKIDIEGAEYEVVKDLEGCLHWVDHFFLEYHGTFEQNQELLEILNILRKSGFQFYINHAADPYPSPFFRNRTGVIFDIQLNIFAFKPQNG